MRFLILASAVLNSALVASAAPTSNGNALPRSCSAAYPESIIFPISFIISQDTGATNKRDEIIAFSIPASSNSCSLEVNFPASYPITSSGDAQVYVYAVDGPSAGSQVGTVTFKSDPNAATKIYVNSFACQNTMTYKLTIGGSAAGSVAFADTAEAGLAMTYC